MNRGMLAGACAAMLVASWAAADVFNMGGGLTSLQVVRVGNAGNPSDTRYAAPGFGAVSYEFKIGAFEVTAGQYCEFLNAVAAVDTYELYNANMWLDSFGCKIECSGGGTPQDPYSYSVAADWANRPVNYVSWGDAARFANWLHNGRPSGPQDASTTEDGAYFLNGATSDADLLAVTRQPDWQWAITSEDEWYKAAYHVNGGPTGDYFDYATGSDTLSSNQLLSTDPGDNANFYQSGYTIGNPYWRTEAGEFANSQSPYGTFDQGGNVWEWNEAVILGSYRGLRGGSFGNTASYLPASSRYSNVPTLETFNYGFRVTQAPQPASAALLALGALALLRRRRPQIR